MSSPQNVNNGDICACFVSADRTKLMFCFWTGGNPAQYLQLRTYSCTKIKGFKNDSVRFSIWTKFGTLLGILYSRNAN